MLRQVQLHKRSANDLYKIILTRHKDFEITALLRDQPLKVILLRTDNGIT